MDLSQDPSPAHTIPLQAGEQVVINGALVTATGPCELQVSPGAYLFTGRDREPRADTLQSAHSTLYFGLLAAYADPERFDTARYSLFEMLGEVVMEERQAKAQKECSRCAAAILSGRIDEAIDSARRLASGAAVSAGHAC